MGAEDLELFAEELADLTMPEILEQIKEGHIDILADELRETVRLARLAREAVELLRYFAVTADLYELAGLEDQSVWDRKGEEALALLDRVEVGE